jgi:hypothetical protein
LGRFGLCVHHGFGPRNPLVVATQCVAKQNSETKTITENKQKQIQKINKNKYRKL